MAYWVNILLTVTLTDLIVMSDEEVATDDVWVQPDDPLLKVAECRTMVFQEPDWLSKVAYEKLIPQEPANPEVYWDLAYVFDEFRAVENHLTSLALCYTLDIFC